MTQFDIWYEFKSLFGDIAQYHAKKSEEKFPEASEKVSSDMYVDDCLSGAEDENKAPKLQQSLETVMQQCGFLSRK